MTQKEIKEKIEILYKALNWCADNQLSSEIVEHLFETTKKYGNLGFYIKGLEAIEEMKKLNLVDNFINTCNSFDISEALEISKRKATYKLKNFNFTDKEKDIILNTYYRSVLVYLTKLKIN